MKFKFLLFFCLIIITANVTFAQAPNVSYSGSQTYYIGFPIPPLAPINQGGTVPATKYGQVVTFAGSPVGLAGASNGTGTSATFYGPTSIVSDGFGNLYVADCFNGLIRKIAPNGTVSTLAGGFDHPRGIAIDKSGNLYLANTYDNTIKKITSAGVVTNLAGNGTAGGTNGTGTSATFNSPEGIAVDASGNVYVGDQYNYAVRKITAAGVVTTLAATGTGAGFNYPSSLAIDPSSGNIYVTDRNNSTIRIITPGGSVTTFLGYDGNTMHGTVTAPSLNYISGIAFDAIGNIYFFDQFNYLLRRATPAAYATTVAGSGTQGIGDGVGNAVNFGYCGGVVVDPAGNVFVADQTNNSIRKIAVTGYTISPSLPAGLSFDSTTGIITGTPTVISSATSYTVTAFNVSGSDTAVINIATAAPPTPASITSFLPSTAPAGATITISGTSFIGVNSVTIGGVTATFNIVSSSTITAIVPTGASSGTITVTNPYGTGILNGFTMMLPPNISYNATPPSYTIGSAIVPLTPTNQGDAIPNIPYGQVNDCAGSGIQGATDGAALVASFYYPRSTVFDSAGNMYVADTYNNVIRKITLAGVVSTFVGSGAAGFTNGTGVSASFNLPNALAIDGLGNIYVTDINNNAVRKISSSGIVSTLAGGSRGYSNATGSAAAFNGLAGIVIDGSGNLYVSDVNNYAIRKITPAGVVTTFAGSGYSGAANGTSSAASFNYPYGLAIDANKNIYVADVANNLIRKITPLGIVTTFAGTGSSGSTDGVGAYASFNAPMRVVADAFGNIYVADAGNNKVRVISPAGVVSTLAGSGVAGSVNGVGTAATMNGPTSISTDGQGSLYFTDNHKIRKITITGYTVSPSLPDGLNLDNATGVLSGTPTSITPATNYIITAYNNVGKSTTIINLATVIPVTSPAINSFSPTSSLAGGIITITGKNLLGATGVSVGGVPVWSYTVISPTSITAVIQKGSSSGNVTVTNSYGTSSLPGFTIIPPPSISYNGPQAFPTNAAITPVAPTNSGGVVAFTPYGQVTTFAGSGASGLQNGIGTVSKFYTPMACTTDLVGNIFVADRNNYAIRKITPSGVVSTFAGGSNGTTDGLGSAASFSSPDDITSDGAGNLYVADFNRIRKITPDGNVSTLAGSGSAGSADGTGISASFNNPAGLVADAVGNVYVADTYNYLIRKITPAGVVTTFAGNGYSASGDGIGLATSFSHPAGITIDPSGNLYVSCMNGLIRKITSLGVVTTIAGVQYAGSADGQGSGASFSVPKGLGADQLGNIYVADGNNNEIRKMTPGGLVSTIAGNLTSGSTNGTGTSAKFYYPSGVTVDQFGNIYVADSFNNLIRKVSLTGYTISPALPAGLAFDSATGIISGTPTALSNPTNYTITLVNAAGSSTTTLNLAVQSSLPPPTITSIGPTTAGPGSIVNIAGTNFSLVKSVSFGGTPAASFTVLSSTSIFAVLGAGSSGTVTVTTYSGSASIAGLTYTTAPTITNFSPRSAVVGKAITISGINFTNVTAVSIGGVNATAFTINSPTVITAIVPTGAVPGNVVITFSTGTDSLAGFALLTPPNITFTNPPAYVTNTAIATLSPLNTGGVVPTTIYAQALSVTSVTTAGSADGTNINASFNGPNAVTFDGLGNLYIADQNNNLIRKMAMPATVTTLAGNGVANFADGAGTSASFSAPKGIVADALGNIYVADYGNNRIRKISPAGIVSTFAGNGTQGAVNGIGGSASFNHPNGLAIDFAGNIYVADQGNNLIRLITSAGVVSTIAGSGTVGSANGPGTQASFSSPAAITVDHSGNIYLTEVGSNLIRKINSSGVVSTLAGSGFTGATNGIASIASFNNPTGIEIDLIGNIYVADQGNNQIRMITPAGVVSTLAGNIHAAIGDGVATQAYFTSPAGIALDGFGNLYVADKGNNVIRKIQLTGYTIDQPLPLGLSFSSFSGSITGSTRIAFPLSTFTVTGHNAVGIGSNTVTISSTQLALPNISYTSPQVLNIGTPIASISPVNTGGAIPSFYYGFVSTFAGSGQSGAASGDATNGSFNVPQGVTFDSFGNLFVTDINNLIRKVTPTGDISTFAGNGNLASINGTGTAASFYYPRAIAVDASNNLYVTEDLSGSIRKISPQGVVTKFGGGFSAPLGIAVDATGNVFLGDNHQIKKITPSGTVSVLAGNGSLGAVDGPGATASFNIPVGLAIDGTGIVYVADRLNNKIRKVTPTGIVTTLAGSGTSGSVDGTGTAASFSNPTGITIDASGNLYVSDQDGNRIRKVTPLGVVTSLAGRPGFGGSTDGIGSLATFMQPNGLALDGSGNLYVAEQINNVIRKISTVDAYNISPILPAGLTFDTTTGIISGNPTVTSPATNYTVTATNITGTASTTLNLSTTNILPQTITFTQPTIAIYGAADFDPNATATSGLPVAYSSSNTSVATIINGHIHILGVGSTVITASQAGNGIYGSAVPVTQTLTVTPAQLIIAANNQTRIYGASNPVLTASYTGFVNGDDATKLTTQPSIVTNAAATSPVNTYPISISGAASINYTINYSPGILTITPAALTVTANDKTKFYTDVNPPLTLSYSGFVNGETPLVLNNQVSVTTTAAVSSPVGTYSITASGASANNYTFNYVPGTLTINPAPGPTIISFSPKTATTGMTITITGTYFFGATAISFGGVPVSLFNVVSPTSVIAIIGTGASGNVSVSTPVGTGTLVGFSFVPLPTINAGSTTTFIAGSSVVLTASPGSGFSYQWLKDGIPIAGATTSTYTATQSGSYTVSVSLNALSQISAPTVVNVIFGLPPTNFKLSTTSATCKGSTNGSILINAVQKLNYTATITGGSLNTPYTFTDSVRVNNLAAGTYNVCLTVAGQPTYQQCFTTVITEPKDIALYTAVIKGTNQVQVSLSGGSLYYVNLNGKVTTTTDSQLTLTLANGVNDISVSTDKPCQGVLNKTISLAPGVLVYPNPFDRTLNLNLGNNIVQKTMITIFDGNGKQVYKQEFSNQSGVVQLDLPGLSSGMYMLKLTADQKETIFKLQKN